MTPPYIGAEHQSKQCVKLELKWGYSMFFGTSDVNAQILSVMEMGWQRINARVGARPFHALAYRLMGDTTFYGDGQEQMQVAADEITFCPAGFSFTKQSDQCRIIVVHFLSDSPLPDSIRRFIPKNPDHFRTAFRALATLWAEKKPGYEYEAKILLYRILLDMERQWAKQSPTDQRLTPALQYISDHLGDSTLSVDTLAKLSNMSDTYFRRLFVEILSITPQKYIHDLRLERATELLRSGYYSVSEISNRCGFNNPNYFSLFIKKATGLSPLQYRKQLLKPQ